MASMESICHIHVPEQRHMAMGNMHDGLADTSVGPVHSFPCIGADTVYSS